MFRSIVGAFRVDDMPLHPGGERVDAHARGGFSRQVIGTGIRHDFRLLPQGSLPSAVRNIARRMVKATVPTPLMTRSCRPSGTSLTAWAAVNLAAIVRLTNVEASRAAPTTDTHKNLASIHAPNATAALKNLPAWAPSGTLACVSAHARHEGSGLYSLGLHLFAAPHHLYVTRPAVANLRPDACQLPRMRRFLRIVAVVNTHLIHADQDTVRLRARADVLCVPLKAQVKRGPVAR